MKQSLRGLICVLTILLCGPLFAQQYVITNSSLNIGNPGGVRTIGDATTTGGTKIHAYNANGGATVNSWSGKVSIPFAFNFYFYVAHLPLTFTLFYVPLLTFTFQLLHYFLLITFRY